MVVRTALRDTQIRTRGGRRSGDEAIIILILSYILDGIAARSGIIIDSPLGVWIPGIAIAGKGGLAVAVLCQKSAVIDAPDGIVMPPSPEAAVRS